jgi:hypothetical protein
VKTEHPEIFQKLYIPLHYQVQGTECIEKAVEEYFKLFENEDKNGMSFKRPVGADIHLTMIFLKMLMMKTKNLIRNLREQQKQ